MNLHKDTNDLKFAPLYLEDPFTLDSYLVDEIKRFEDLDKNILTQPTTKNMTLSLDNNLGSRNLSLDALPFTPYPIEIQNLEASELSENDFNNFVPFNENDNSDIYPDDSDLNYPDDVDDSDLFPYNKPQLNLNNNIPMINPINILRSLNIDDIEASDNVYRSSHKPNDINSIFKKIEDDNTIIIATMKAYRIPYPIAKLLVKKIISLTLKYKG